MRWGIFSPWKWLVDRHVDRAFRPRPDGAIAFYPFGKWVDGYGVTTREQETALRVAMRRYVLFYLRVGEAFFWVFAGAAYLLSKVLPSLSTGVPLWLIASGTFIFLLAPGVAIGAFLVVWQRRFKTLARGLEVLPPTFTRLALVQSAARRTERTSVVVRAATGSVFAATSLVLLVWQERRFDRWETVLISLGAVAGLGYYVWCRLVMRTEQTLHLDGDAEPAAPGDGKGGRA